MVHEHQAHYRRPRCNRQIRPDTATADKAESVSIKGNRNEEIEKAKSRKENTMTKAERITQFVDADLARNPIRSQEDVCLLAARASIHVSGKPSTDLEFIDAAAGAARGLFGPAYEAADEAQRWTWNDMCERALRIASI